MDQHNDNFERIKQFLDDEMSLKERNAFEVEMKEDDRLSAEVEEQKLLNAGLYVVERDRLKTQALGWMNGSQSSKEVDSTTIDSSTLKTPTISISRLIGIAASFLLFACIGYFLFFNKSQDVQELTNTQLANYHQDPVVLRGGPKDQSWSDAIKHYRNRNFDKMINTMKDDVYSKNVNIEQLFYFGLAQLYRTPAQLDSAQYYLSRTNVDYNLTFRDEAVWYNALIFIKKGETTAAIPYLKQLADSTGIYSSKAADLLKSLNE